MGDVELDLSNMDVKREQELWTEQNGIFCEESQDQTYESRSDTKET
jgi:hypothetical protein